MRDFKISAASSMVKSPCSKECTGRKVGCHSSCAAYIEYVKKKEIIKNDIAKKAAINRDFDEYRTAAIEKIRRSH